MTRHVWMRPFAPLAFAVLALASCSRPGPAPVEYVLGTMPTAINVVVPATQLPVIEVRHIQFPDYLDNTDILERNGNRLVPRPDARWGERLSVGMTRALTALLAARLPRMEVTATAPVAPPARQILLDVVAFEPIDGHLVVLAARWTIADSHRVLLAERGSFVEPIAGHETEDIVTAMSRALAALAARLAAELEQGLPAG